jgi:hypothetical protein
VTAAVEPQLHGPVAGPAVEKQLATDLVKRGLVVAPVILLLATLGWGVDGLASAAYAEAIVLVNFALAAALLTWAARIGLGMLMVTALIGFVLRAALVVAAVLLVADAGWLAKMPLGLTLIVTHLGLLLWETRYVSASLAFPGLKPDKPKDKE